MRTRTLTTLALWVVIVLVVILFRLYGGVALLAAVGGFALAETYDLLARFRTRPEKTAGVVAGSLFLVLLLLFGLTLPGAAPYAIALALSLVGLIAWTFFRSPPAELVARLAPTLFGFLLVPGCLGFLVLIGTTLGQTRSEGLFLALWVIAVAKASDIGALLVGSRIGRTPLAPAYSPKKTVEGGIGGLAGSVLVGIVLALLFLPLVPDGFHLGTWIVTGLLLGATAILSDLLGSALKRTAGVKDSGHGLPGIGGALDLADSLLLAAPVGYLCLLLFTG